MQQGSKVQQRKKGAKSLMQRNVTQFRHLLSKCYITENDLTWTMGLRDNQIPKVIEHREPQAPQVFFKKTMISTIRQQMKKGNDKFTLHANQYEHMLVKKLEKTPEKQTLQQLKFYSQLRKSRTQDLLNGTKSNKQFDIIPFREKHQFPQFIKKQYLKKTTAITEHEKESAFDGAQNQPKYTNKLKVKNYSSFEPLARARGRKKVELPSLAWEVGLRNY